MTRMSSPDGSEILTVDSEVGASVLASLGWSMEGEAKPERRSEPAKPKADPGEAVSDEQEQEQTTKRRPGRPRKNPVDEE